MDKSAPGTMEGILWVISAIGMTSFIRSEVAFGLSNTRCPSDDAFFRRKWYPLPTFAVFRLGPRISMQTRMAC